MMKDQPLRDILLDTAEMDAPFAMKGGECSCFSHGWVAVNHRSTPVILMKIKPLYIWRPTNMTAECGRKA